MRAFVIADASKRKAKPIGILLWWEDERQEQGRFVIELSSRCNTATLPLSLAFCAQRPNRRATEAESRQWVESRIVPPDRHNIASVLLANGLAEYSEVALIASSRGRAADDDYQVYEVPLSKQQEQQLAAGTLLRNRTSDGKAAEKEPENRADAFLSMVERKRRGPQVEYALIPFESEEAPLSHGEAGGIVQAAQSASRADGSGSAAKRIGEQIRARRLDAGLTQTQLAARAGISQVVLSRLETGSGNPTLALLEEISYALGTELAVSLGA